MNEPETREERVLRIMWEQNVSRASAERVADAEMRLEERRALVLLALAKHGKAAAA